MNKLSEPQEKIPDKRSVLARASGHGATSGSRQARERDSRAVRTCTPVRFTQRHKTCCPSEIINALRTGIRLHGSRSEQVLSDKACCKGSAEAPPLKYTHRGYD